MEFFDADVILGRKLDQDEETMPSAADLIAEMDRSSIARSLVTHHKIANSNIDSGNADVQRDVAGQARLRGLFGVWPIQERDTPRPETAVDHLINIGAAGVQLWPVTCMFEFAPWQCPDLFGALSERHLPIFVHADQAGYAQSYAVLQAFPNLTLVLQRVPYVDGRKLLGLMKACPNLHLCASPPFVGGRVIEAFDRFVGCERLLFGSGLFEFDASPAVAQIAYAELSEPKKAMIAGGNLLRLLECIR